jgi:hypothetical protein
MELEVTLGKFEGSASGWGGFLGEVCDIFGCLE